MQWSNHCTSPMKKSLRHHSSMLQTNTSVSFSSVSQISHSFLFFFIFLTKINSLSGTYIIVKVKRSSQMFNMRWGVVRKQWNPRLSPCYDGPFTVGPNVFFLGAAAGWGLVFGADAGFLALGCRDLRPSTSQYLLHWCKALNWSMKEVAQFPLKPLYLERDKLLTHRPARIKNLHLLLAS